jgi:predicted patatin/cPLA2 family phospholipase
MYNAQLDYVARQAAEGNALLICPDRPLDIGRLEMNRQKIQAIYDAGREKTLQMLDEIRRFVSAGQPRTSE